MDELVSFLNQTTRMLLDLDPDGREKLAGLKGRTFCIEVTVPQVTLYLVPTDHGLKFANECTGEPDVTLTGPLSAFIRLSRPDSQGNLSANSQISMHGDAEAGQAFGKVLSQLDIDWEEGLSRFVGDTSARKIGNVVRDLSDWATESMDLSRTNAAEYLQEEKRLLVTDLARERFRNDVNALRADVDRIEQRILRLMALKDRSSAENRREDPEES